MSEAKPGTASNPSLSRQSQGQTVNLASFRLKKKPAMATPVLVAVPTRGLSLSQL